MNLEEYASFLVRFWREPSSAGQPGCWHGEIEHIQSGIRQSFGTLSELLAFLQGVAGAPSPRLKTQTGEPTKG